MKVCFVLLIWISLVELRYGAQMWNKSTSKYVTKENDIIIKILIHIDQPLTKKLARIHSINTRKKLKTISHKLLEDVRKLFNHPSLNQAVQFKLINTRFLRNSSEVTLDENAPRYLKSYCDWQAVKKLSQNNLFYSVLLTGLDLFHLNNGRKIRSNSGRGYTRGICNFKKSCAIIEWDPNLAGFLLAHEIGHSLGIRHDGPPYNQCKSQQNIMALRFDERRQPKSWSPCSWYSLRQFLKTNKAWCVKPKTYNRTTQKRLQ